MKELDDDLVLESCVLLGMDSTAVKVRENNIFRSSLLTSGKLKEAEKEHVLVVGRYRCMLLQRKKVLSINSPFFSCLNDAFQGKPVLNFHYFDVQDVTSTLE